MNDFIHYVVAGSLWGFVIIAGPVLLGMAIAYGVVTNRARTRRERDATERATRQLYKEIDRDDKADHP